MPPSSAADSGSATEIASPGTSIPIVRVEGIWKSFGTAPVLRNVSLDFYSGQVHALVGENGAGKSTIAKIIAGAVLPDTGAVLIDDEPILHATPVELQRRGISIIFQEPMLFPDLSVAENIYIGRQPRRNGRPWPDRRLMIANAQDLLTRIGSSLRADRLVRGLSVAEMQMVEIAAAVSHETRLLIVDEPTASLTPTEVGRLFGLLRSLRGQGTAVLFIGHRLEEVFEIADQITVLRDGEVVASRLTTQWNERDLIKAMVGRKTEGAIERTVAASPKGSGPTGEELLRVDELSRSGVFRDISFTVRAGEIVGMAGLVGAGRSEIARSAFGIDTANAGRVTVSGRKLPLGRPDEAITAGLAYVPEDRKAEGLAERLPVYENIVLLLRSTAGHLGWLRSRKEIAVARDFVKQLDIRTTGVRQKTAELSGGNQQKVLLAKWLATGPKVLILDEPTRGVDVGAKEGIHRLIDELAHDGLGILLISSDMPEVLALSDRILVIREGQLAGELTRGCSAEDVLELAVLTTAELERNGASA